MNELVSKAYPGMDKTRLQELQTAMLVVLGMDPITGLSRRRTAPGLAAAPGADDGAVPHNGRKGSTGNRRSMVQQNRRAQSAHGASRKSSLKLSSVAVDAMNGAILEESGGSGSGSDTPTSPGVGGGAGGEAGGGAAKAPRERRTTRDVEEAASAAAASLLQATAKVALEGNSFAATPSGGHGSGSGSASAKQGFLRTSMSFRASRGTGDLTGPAAAASANVNTLAVMAAMATATANPASVRGSAHGASQGSMRVSLLGSASGRHQSTSALMSRFSSSRKSHPNRKDKQLALVFFTVVKMMLAPPLRTAILIEDAHLCDELSWIELSRWPEIVSHTAVMLTMVTKPGTAQAQRRPSQENASAFVPFLGVEGDDRGAMIARSGAVVSDANRPVFYHPETVVVEMAGLTEGEVKELLERYFGSGGSNMASSGGAGAGAAALVVSDELARAVHLAAAGSPFWCATIAKFIKERGVEEFQRSMESDQRGLNFIVLTRMEKLSAECQTVVKCASVIGTEFTVSLLACVLPNRMGTDEAKVRESCGNIVDIGFFHCADGADADDPTYSFRNDFIAKALVQLTPPSEASRIHLLTAQYIETEYADLRPHYDSLIGHYQESNYAERQSVVFRHACEAAEYKILGESYAQGLRYCQLALTCVENVVQIRRLADIATRGHEELVTSKGALGGGADGAAANPHRITGAEADSLLGQYKLLMTQMEEKAHGLAAVIGDADREKRTKEAKQGCTVS